MGKLLQCYTAFAASYSALLMAMLNVWPSYTISKYTDVNTTLLSVPMTPSETSSLGSLPSLGAMVGTALIGPLIDKIGRQKGGMIICVIFVLSWMVIGQTTSSTVVLTFRFISGIPGGANLVYAPMFISEVAEDSIRGALASVPIFSYTVGVLLSYIIGWFLPHKVIIWTNIAMSTIGVLLCFMVIESPMYLLRQGREEDARKALAKYRGVTPESKVILEEISRLKASINLPVEMVSITDSNKTEESEKLNPINEKDEKADLEASETPKRQTALRALFLSPTNRKIFTIVGTALTLQVFMGMVPVQVFSNQIFGHAAPDLSSDLCSVLLAVVLVASSGLSAVIADIAGRRILIISSSILTSICMFLLGFLMQFSVAPPWVSAMVMLLYCFSFLLGAGGIPYVLMAEVFTPEIQSLASMLLVEWAWLTNYIIIELFNIARTFIGMSNTFYIFAVVGVINAITSFFRVPETKGLSNEQIQEVFRRK